MQVHSTPLLIVNLRLPPLERVAGARDAAAQRNRIVANLLQQLQEVQQMPGADLLEQFGSAVVLGNLGYGSVGSTATVTHKVLQVRCSLRYGFVEVSMCALAGPHTPPPPLPVLRRRRPHLFLLARLGTFFTPRGSAAHGVCCRCGVRVRRRPGLPRRPRQPSASSPWTRFFISALARRRTSRIAALARRRAISWHAP